MPIVPPTGLVPFPVDRSPAKPAVCSGVKPQYLSIDYPKSDFYPLNPQAYSTGFSKDGRIIGTNLARPYPSALPHYHDIPFRRSVDWFAPAIIGENDSAAWETVKRRGKNRPGSFTDGCQHCELSETAQLPGVKSTAGKKPVGSGGNRAFRESEDEVDEAEKVSTSRTCCFSPYPKSYIVDDPSYKAWVDGKIDAQRDRDKRQEEMLKVPWELKLIKGHYAPAILQTTNEVYGNFLDMLPKRPFVYPEVEDFQPKPLPVRVRYRRSNMSDHPPIPDHAFAVPREELQDRDGHPLRGFFGAPFYADNGGLGEGGAKLAAELRQQVAEGKLPTKADKSQEKGHTVLVAGEGVPPPPPDPWTFRRSTVVAGKVVGEREQGRTWPMHTSTGLELNRPLPRAVTMSIACEKSDRPVESVEVPWHPKKGVYYQNPTPSHQGPRRIKCTPKDPNFSGYSRKHPCHRDFFNVETLPVPDGWKKSVNCDVIDKSL